MAAARKKPTAEGPVPRRLWIMPPLALGAGGRAFGNRCQLQQCDLVAMAPQDLEAESMEHEDLPGVRDHLRLVQHEAGEGSGVVVRQMPELGSASCRERVCQYV